MKRFLILAIAALLTGLAVNAPGAFSALVGLSGTATLPSDPLPPNGVCIDPDGMGDARAADACRKS